MVLFGTTGLFAAGLDLILDKGSLEDLVSCVFVCVEKMWEVIGFSKEMRPEESLENSDRNIRELNYPDLKVSPELVNRKHFEISSKHLKVN